MIKVVCTEEKIKDAEQRDSKHCWIAEAIREAAPYLTNITVDTATCRGTDEDKGLRYVYLTPQAPRNAIYMFDHGLKVDGFVFYLRHAQVFGVRRKDGAKKRMSAENWRKTKEQIKNLRSQKGLLWADVAKEMGVSEGTLQGRLSDNDIPTKINVDKMEKWVLKQTGEKPAPRRKSLAEHASGPARIRPIDPTHREQPEIIGGKEPVFDETLRLRQFGLRQLDWKIPGTETTLRIPDYPPLREENK